MVPVEAETEGLWTHPPFAGHVEDGYIWGRGALDDKNRVLAILEAIDMLLKEGFRTATLSLFGIWPRRGSGGTRRRQEYCLSFTTKGH